MTTSAAAALKGLLHTLEWLEELQDTSLMPPLEGESMPLSQVAQPRASASPQPPRPSAAAPVMPAPSRGALPNVEDARARAASATTLDELYQSLLSFDGCSLKNTAMNTVFSDGMPTAKIMLVGEAPGADEDRQGKPFVGLSGQLLDKIFESIGLSREQNLYISNVVPWRPPGNRTPTPEEIALCRPFLEKHIALVRPEILVLVGNTSVKAVLQTPEGITRLHGTWRTFQNPYLKEPVLTLPIYHPAFLLRSPGKKRDMWRAMLALQERLRSISRGS